MPDAPPQHSVVMYVAGVRCFSGHRLRRWLRSAGICVVSWWPITAGWIFAGCGSQAQDALAITLVPPLSVHVGREVSVPLAVPVPTSSSGSNAAGKSTAESDLVDWQWRSLTLPDLDMRLRHPTLTAYTLGRAVWRWTPVATDLGEQEMEFVARIPKSGQTGATQLRFVVDSGDAMVQFHEPVGEGTTLDLRRAECVHVAIVVESSSSPHVELTLGDDPPSTARLLQISDTTGELVFCPNAEQIAADTVYPFTLQATDDRQTVEKLYVVVLRRAS